MLSPTTSDFLLKFFRSFPKIFYIAIKLTPILISIILNKTMKKKVLITGGAGFIGSHLADELLNFGYEVRALDNLSEQVHGKNCERPEYLNPQVELMVGDVRDKKIVEQALDGVDAVFHLAAMVGVGQSMYEIKEYTDVNNTGTAVLLEALVKNPVQKLVVASSMSIYGEGLYQNAAGEISYWFRTALGAAKSRPVGSTWTKPAANCSRCQRLKLKCLAYLRYMLYLNTTRNA